MDRITLKAQERELLGKKVKKLRRDGFVPAHVFGRKVETDHVSVKLADFIKVFNQAGETSLVNLKIEDKRVKPVLIREVQLDPVKGLPLHIDFYQVNLHEKVKVPVPVVIVGEEPEIVHSGEAVVIQPMGELEVEALPTELPEHIEVDITSLKQIDDAITVAELKIADGIEIMADPEAVVVKLDSAVSADAAELMEEMAQAEAAAEVAEGEGAEAAEGEASENAEATEGSSEAADEESSKE